jgi:ribA/ribD-fused uncharacterized protein
MKYSVAWLQQELESGGYFDYLFFWGHTQKREGVIDKSCFSQWYASGFTIDGIKYLTAEHWMMAKKALLFDDRETLEKILASKKPAIVKQLGREVRSFDAEIWARCSYEIVVEGNKHKFSQNDLLKKFLLQTGNQVIVEASPADTGWGIGLSQDAKEAMNPFEWKGSNLLGFALMEARDILK